MNAILTFRSAGLLAVGQLSAGLLALGTMAAAAQSGPIAITGQPVTAGAAVSGGRFQIAGTVGQPSAGPRLTGGCLSIDPGFWGAYAPIATPGAPTLRVQPIAFNYVRVAFAPGCSDWVLQWTRTLESDPRAIVWTDDAPSNLVLTDGELVREFHVPSWGPRLFFRLRQR